jgi:PAS domain S-box-containing protein
MTTQPATTHYESGDLDHVFSDAAERHPPGHRHLLIRGVLIFAALIVVAVGVAYWIVSQRETRVVGELAQRTGILAETRAQVLAARLESLGNAGLRLSRSDVFRLFASEASRNGDIGSRESALAAQIPYMMQAVTQFARQEGLVGVYLVDGKGRVIIASAGAPNMSPGQRRSATAAIAAKARAVTPARQYVDGLSLDVILPVAPPQEENPAAPRNVSGVFVLATPVHTTLAEVLKDSPLALEGESTRLFQVGASEVQEIVPGGRPVLEPVTGAPLAPRQSLPFAQRAALGGGAPVYSYGTWVPGVPWMVVQEANAAEARASLRTFTWGVSTVGVLLTLCIVIGFVAFWRHQTSEHNLALATQYRELGSRIAAQRRFLGSLMNSLTEMIGLKRKSRTYIYGNPSFARMIGRTPEGVEGLSDAEVFGRGTAERLRHSDERALASDKPVVVEEVLHLPDGVRHFQMSKVAYRGESGEVEGILVAARDVTEIREAEQRRQRGLQAMTRAFVRVIEQVDPYLGGHSENVRDVSVGIATGLHVPQDVLITVDIAAMLAQIGKLSIPAEIVAKAERLSPDEVRIMQGHITQAVRILKDVEFGLPVVDAIGQMYERLDGSGYPANRVANDICLPARILGVADVFAARIVPRSYREGISPEEAMQLLVDHPERYDATVVTALRQFIDSIDGEKFLARVQGR